MGAVIKLAGVNGSGKTTLAREFMRLTRAEPIEYSGKKVLAYGGRLESLGLKFFLLGSYKSVCGGMDTIGDQETKSYLVRKYAQQDALLLFEGILTGVTYGEFGAFSETPAQRGRWLYAFMGTPFDVCVERVRARRVERGNTTPFDPERSMHPKVRALESVQRRAVEAGHAVYTVNYKSSPAVAASKLLKTVKEEVL